MAYYNYLLYLFYVRLRDTVYCSFMVVCYLVVDGDNRYNGIASRQAGRQARGQADGSGRRVSSKARFETEVYKKEKWKWQKRRSIIASSISSHYNNTIRVCTTVLHSTPLLNKHANILVTSCDIIP